MATCDAGILLFDGVERALDLQFMTTSTDHWSNQTSTDNCGQSTLHECLPEELTMHFYFWPPRRKPG